MTRTVLSMMLGFEVIIGLIFLCLIVLPLSFLFLLLYRRSLRRSMRSVETQTIDPASSESTIEGEDQSPINGSLTTSTSQSAIGLIQKANRRRRVAAMLYAIAGTVQAAGMTFLMFGNPVYWHMQLPLWPTFLVLLWPTVLTVVWLCGWNTIRSAVTVVIYLTLAICAALVFGVGPKFLEIHLIGPLIITLAVANRSMRPVAPWLLVVVLPGIFTEIFFSLSLKEPIGIALLAGSIGFGLMYVPIVANIYRRKLASDQALVLNALWLAWVLFESINLIILAHTLKSGWAPFLGIVTYLIFRAILAVGMRVLRRSTRATRGTRLLVLRTFVAKGKNSRLIHKVIEKWRYVGSINLIAAPDLATDYLEPHKLIDFLLRRTDKKFIDNEVELKRAFDAIDTEPDLDARYRVNDFFCRDTTWKMAFNRLADTSDAVLMDLRGFSEKKEGCLYEINYLIDRGMAHRAVLVTDTTTDLAFLDHILLQKARSLAIDSSAPDRSFGMTLKDIGKKKGAVVDSVFAALCKDAG